MLLTLLKNLTGKPYGKALSGQELNGNKLVASGNLKNVCLWLLQKQWLEYSQSNLVK